MARYKIDGKTYPSVTEITGLVIEPIVLNIYSSRCAVDYIVSRSTQTEDGSIIIKPEVFEEAKEAYKLKSEENMSIGSNVHQAIDLHIRGYDEQFITGTILKSGTELNCYNQFLKWEKNNDVKYLESEITVFEPKLGYAGTSDCIAIVNGIKMLIDWKTSGRIGKEYWLQVSAYIHARNHLVGVHEIYTNNGLKKVEYKDFGVITAGAVVRLDKDSDDYEFVIKDYDSLVNEFNSFKHLLSYWYSIAKRKLDNERIDDAKVS